MRQILLFLILLTCAPLLAQTPKWEQFNPITTWSKKDTTTVPKWNVLEITLKGPRGGNPFKEVQFSAVFQNGGEKFTARGFYDGGGDYKIRFMPPSEGEWHFRTLSNESKLDGHEGMFLCTPADSGSHGPVRVHNTYHFAYADGSPYWPVGTTAYAWIHQPEEKQLETLQTLAEAPFNKIRMTVFPKSYVYNSNEPDLYPFPRSRRGKNDFSEFNVKFFRHLEKRIINLMNLGVEADVILFHPYDRWGYAEMSKDEDDFYLRYTTFICAILLHDSPHSATSGGRWPMNTILCSPKRRKTGRAFSKSSMKTIPTPTCAASTTAAKFMITACPG